VSKAIAKAANPPTNEERQSKGRGRGRGRPRGSGRGIGNRNTPSLASVRQQLENAKLTEKTRLPRIRGHEYLLLSNQN